ncbi:MAG TPA: RNA polymerase sigma factor region1.1 domain-containing protein, partial [Burkholderiaceae bacterium]|nr:RNA polymerase sigma factor region1.1 domain-containing protein [Burkholderiaceae bacterium]
MTQDTGKTPAAAKKAAKKVGTKTAAAKTVAADAATEPTTTAAATKKTAAKKAVAKKVAAKKTAAKKTAAKKAVAKKAAAKKAVAKKAAAKKTAAKKAAAKKAAAKKAVAKKAVAKKAVAKKTAAKKTAAKKAVRKAVAKKSTGRRPGRPAKSRDPYEDMDDNGEVIPELKPLPSRRGGKRGKADQTTSTRKQLTPEEQEARRNRLKVLIRMGKDRGYLTYGEINDHLSDDLVDAEAIDGIISTFSDMGISVYDQAPDADSLLMSDNVTMATVDDDVDDEADAALTTVDSD